MEIFILDEKFRSLYNVDTFESLIWTERYNGCGNFEFYTPVNEILLQVVNTVQKKMETKLDCYAWLKESSSTMVIEDLEITTDVETGNHLIVSGRGLESLLERRIIWTQTVVNGNLQNGVQKLLNENVINPSIADRKIPNFVFSKSSNSYIDSLTLRAQYTGDNLYDTIMTICDTYKMGFDVILDEDDRFVFTLTYGTDRSYDQETIPYVIFSPRYENIINSDYLESSKTLKNVTLVAGEDSGLNRKTRVVGSASGLSRRELYTDARDIQSEGYNEELDSDKEKLNEYKQQLADVQKSLTDETTEYNKKKAESETTIANHQNRISALNQRISYYNQQITSYQNGLDSSQLSSFNARNQYKSQIAYYDGLINDCSNKINNYNDKLRNEATLTYAKIVQYEQGIDSEESKKKGYEETKKPIEDNKKTAEENLPNYETTLKTYEDKISNYEDIVANDQKAVTDETENLSKETAEYNKKKNEYQTQITSLNQTIASYESKIASGQAELTAYYNGLLDQRGLDKLSENAYISVFTGEIEATKTFIYGREFFKGDIVQIVNEFGMESKVRVSEVVRVHDTSGYSMYPTFQVIE